MEMFPFSLMVPALDLCNSNDLIYTHDHTDKKKSYSKVIDHQMACHPHRRPIIIVLSPMISFHIFSHPDSDNIIYWCFYI